MCGIVGAIADRDIVPILMEGLRRLEYRGYDSTGVAVLQDDGTLALRRSVGKVVNLAEKVEQETVAGVIGVAHSRWATHGGVTEANAHPHVSGDRIAVIHNGIIENFETIKADLTGKGYVFKSETDSEVIGHLIHSFVVAGMDLREAVQASVAQFHGAYAIVVIDIEQPDRVLVARIASPLVVGLGEGENFVASDVQALLPVTRRFQFLEEGDVADIRREGVTIFDASGASVERKVHESSLSAAGVEKGDYPHFMLKEIHEQPRAIADTLSERLAADHVLEPTLGPRAAEILPQVSQIHIIACGTSYHAGLVARYAFESIAQVPCMVEVASEYRYRKPVVPPGTLFLAISQSGETADTLAAMREARKLGYVATAAICNVPESSVVREADLVLMTRAGPEVSVASTKAFTTQLAALNLFCLALAKRRGCDDKIIASCVRQLLHVPEMVDQALQLDAQIREWAEYFVPRNHALFLGRGPSYPVAMEGALKMKEISYIHAEAYAAGELKHGPLALVNEDMPVIAVAPNDELLEKLKSNLQEVRARGGKLFVFADPHTGFRSGDGIEVMRMPEHVEPLQAPMVYTIPLQLLSYHVAVLRGTDVDQPRNLAKSVTVE